MYDRSDLNQLTHDFLHILRCDYGNPKRPRLIFEQSPSYKLYMPFFEGAKTVDISGGEFNDIGGNLNKYDNSRHTHYVNSHNTTNSTTKGSYNDSSTRKGELFLPYVYLKSTSLAVTGQYPGNSLFLRYLMNNAF